MPYTLDTYALVTLDNVREHLSIPDAVTVVNNVLTRMINTATTMIENDLGRNIKQRQYVEYHDGRNNDRILLRQWPATKPTEIYIDNSSEFTDANLILDTADYDLDLDSKGVGIGVVLLNGRLFDNGTRNIKITYNGGYAATPNDLIEATLLTVEWLYDIRSDRRVGVQSKSKNNENITFLGNLPELVLNILDRYRRYEFPITASQIMSV